MTPENPGVLQISLDLEPSIVVTFGGDQYAVYRNRFDGNGVGLAPIEKAATVARLRALADLLEESGQ